MAEDIELGVISEEQNSAENVMESVLHSGGSNKVEKGGDKVASSSSSRDDKVDGRRRKRKANNRRLPNQKRCCFTNLSFKKCVKTFSILIGISLTVATIVAIAITQLAEKKMDDSKQSNHSDGNLTQFGTMFADALEATKEEINSSSTFNTNDTINSSPPNQPTFTNITISPLKKISPHSTTTLPPPTKSTPSSIKNISISFPKNQSLTPASPVLNSSPIDYASHISLSNTATPNTHPPPTPTNMTFSPPLIMNNSIPEDTQRTHPPHRAGYEENDIRRWPGGGLELTRARPTAMNSSSSSQLSSKSQPSSTFVTPQSTTKSKPAWMTLDNASWRQFG